MFNIYELGKYTNQLTKKGRRRSRKIGQRDEFVKSLVDENLMSTKKKLVSNKFSTFFLRKMYIIMHAKCILLSQRISFWIKFIVISRKCWNQLMAFSNEKKRHKYMLQFDFSWNRFSGTRRSQFVSFSLLFNKNSIIINCWHIKYMRMAKAKNWLKKKWNMENQVQCKGNKKLSIWSRMWKAPR